MLHVSMQVFDLAYFSIFAPYIINFITMFDRTFSGDTDKPGDCLSRYSKCTFFMNAGPRFVCQIGEKTIDYNDEFRMFLSTRNPNPIVTPDAMALITEVNFTTTRAGLISQVFVQLTSWLDDVTVVVADKLSVVDFNRLD